MSALDGMDWSGWLRGLVAGFIGGGATAVSNGITMQIMDSKDFSIGGVNSLKIMGVSFLVGGCLNAIMFLKQSPIPSVRTTVVQTVSTPLSMPITTTTTTLKTVENLPPSPPLLPSPKIGEQ